LPPPLYERVVDLQNEKLDWNNIEDTIEIEFKEYINLNHDTFCKWHDLTKYARQQLRNIETILIKNGYRQIDIFHISDDELFKFFNERSIEYICIDDYTKNMYVMFIKEKELTKAVSIIGLHQYSLLKHVAWYSFNLHELSIAKEIAENKKISQYDSNVYSLVSIIVRKWVKENNVMCYHAMHDGRIYLERDCDAALFKITFV